MPRVDQAARVVAVDLDGTLLGSDGCVSARTRKVISQLHRAAWPLVVTTARPLREVLRIPELAASTALICGNGTLVHDPEQGVETFRDYMPSPAAVHSVDRIRHAFPECLFGADAHPDLILEEGFALRSHWLPATRIVTHIESVLDHSGVAKLLVQFPSDAVEYLQLLGELALPGIEVTCSSSDFCEITSAGVTKARALARVVEDELGRTAAEVIAFGDMPNDIPMLQWAGSGIAVSNAHESVLSVADQVTESNDDDGVAYFLEKYLKSVGSTRKELR